MYFKKRIGFFGTVLVVWCFICSALLTSWNSYHGNVPNVSSYVGADVHMFSENGSPHLREHKKQLESTYCPNLPIPNDDATETRWQPVTDDNKYYVYSAYIDGNQVRIVGASTSGIHKLNCQLWFKRRDSNVYMTTVPATVERIPEHQNLKYAAAYYVCQSSKDQLPYAVSLVGKEACQSPSNVVRIHEHKGEKRKFSVCVKPFVYNYSRAYELVEWLELNIALGVTHFTFYNYSSDANIKHVLDLYSKRGLVEVLPFNLPMKISTWPPSDTIELHAFGHLVSSNDCLHRHVGITEYLSIFDVDEFIVPKHNDDFTWADMFKRLPDASEYTFRNCFFRKEWTDSPEDTNTTVRDLIRNYRLVTLTKLQREERIWRRGQRSKLIVKPGDIEMMGIHNVWRSRAGDAHTVSPDIGMLHHYRDWERGDDRQRRVPDDTMLKFKDTIIGRVRNTWDQLPGVEMDMPK